MNILILFYFFIYLIIVHSDFSYLLIVIYSKLSVNSSIRRPRNNFIRLYVISSKISSNSHSPNKKFDKFKRTSYDQTNKKYRLITDFDEKNNKNYWLNNN